jgi:DNA-binding IclR family transcriptional regulator
MTQHRPSPIISPQPAPTRGVTLSSYVLMAGALLLIMALVGAISLRQLAQLETVTTDLGENKLPAVETLGLVAQDVDSQRYRLGPEAINIGLAAMRQSDPVRAAEPALVRLREGLEVTCFVAVMGNKGPTVMRFEEPGLPVTVNVRAGSVMSMLWSATGRAFLGLLNERSVRELAEQELAAAPREMRAQLDAKQPIEALRAEVRALRCAVVRDTYLRGISAVAAPVHDFTGRVCAVITALGASGGFDPSADGAIATAVLREAAATSEVLGYLVPKEC